MPSLRYLTLNHVIYHTVGAGSLLVQGSNTRSLGLGTVLGFETGDVDSSPPDPVPIPLTQPSPSGRLRGTIDIPSPGDRRLS